MSFAFAGSKPQVTEGAFYTQYLEDQGLISVLPHTALRQVVYSETL